MIKTVVVDILRGMVGTFSLVLESVENVSTFMEFSSNNIGGLIRELFDVASGKTDLGDVLDRKLYTKRLTDMAENVKNDIHRAY
jgi:hypothetical protein